MKKTIFPSSSNWQTCWVWPGHVNAVLFGPSRLCNLSTKAWTDNGIVDTSTSSVSTALTRIIASSNASAKRPIDQFFDRCWFLLLEFVVHFVLHTILSSSRDCDESWVRDHRPTDLRHGGIPVPNLASPSWKSFSAMCWQQTKKLGR